MDDGGAVGGGDVAHPEGLLLGAPLHIFHAWSDEPWINEGAAVRVSLLCFGYSSPSLRGTAESASVDPTADRRGTAALAMTARLDGQPVAFIHADLTAGSEVLADLTIAKRLPENGTTCFEGIKKYGAFDVSGLQIRRWLPIGGNPNGRPNADVLKPWINATDVVRRDSDTWGIDFTDLSERAAALYEAPFLHAQSHVKPERARDRNKRTREIWWMFERARPELRKACAELPRYIVTPVVAKHRVFAWRSAPTLVCPAWTKAGDLQRVRRSE